MQVEVDCGELYDTHEVENQIVWDVMYSEHESSILVLLNLIHGSGTVGASEL